jgi:hypothetical protein
MSRYRRVSAVENDERSSYAGSGGNGDANFEESAEREMLKE